MSILFGLVAVAALLAVNAFFVAAEFSLVAVDRPRIEAAANSADPQARRVRSLLQHLTLHMSGAQFGITLSALLLGFVAEPTVARILTGEAHLTGVSVAVAIALATILHLVVGEQIPKYVALAAPNRVARRLAPLVQIYGTVARPVVHALNGAANVVVHRLGVEPREELGVSRTLDELKELIRDSSDATLDPTDVELLTRSIRFGNKTVADALVPRLDMEALSVDSLSGELLTRSRQTGYSRFPVFDGDLDHVVGVVHVKSLLSRPAETRDRVPLGELMGDVLAVPKTRDLDELLGDLRHHSRHLAVVVDEHGGTAGIITVEDVLEEIVGEIDDEHDHPVSPTQIDGRAGRMVSGSSSLDEVRDSVGLPIPDGPYETLAGFVLHRLGRLPDPATTIQLKGWGIEVMVVEGRRIAKLRVVAPLEGRQTGSSQ